MAIIVDGKKIGDEILDNLKGRVQKLITENKQPALAVVLVGDDLPSHTYVRKKQEAAAKIGIDFQRYDFPVTISPIELANEVRKIREEGRSTGIIIQLPLPENLYAAFREIVRNIHISMDVDCLTRLSLGKLLMNESTFIPPTPGAVLEILRFYNVDLQNKHVCLIGRGKLIGKPLAAMLLNQKVALSVHSEYTRDLKYFTQDADIIVTGVGKCDILTGEMVKGGCVVIDTGTHYHGPKKIRGDVHFKTVEPKARLITPVPGGVGPITVAKLLENVVIAAEKYL